MATEKFVVELDCDQPINQRKMARALEMALYWVMENDVGGTEYFSGERVMREGVRVAPAAEVEQCAS